MNEVNQKRCAFIDVLKLLNSDAVNFRSYIQGVTTLGKCHLMKNDWIISYMSSLKPDPM